MIDGMTQRNALIFCYSFRGKSVNNKAPNEIWKKQLLGFRLNIIWEIFKRFTGSHFIKHKPLISEECITQNVQYCLYSKKGYIDRRVQQQQYYYRCFLIHYTTILSDMKMESWFLLLDVILRDMHKRSGYTFILCLLA